MIRLATPADLPALIELDRASPSAAHWTEQQYRQTLHHQPGSPPRLVIVAEHLLPTPSDASHKSTSEIRGFLVASHLAPDWELENIVVIPTARRGGLGTELLNALVAKARSTNSEALFLEVRESNLAARVLYEKAGFALTGHRKSYYTNPPEDAALYRLGLP